MCVIISHQPLPFYSSRISQQRHQHESEQSENQDHVQTGCFKNGNVGKSCPISDTEIGNPGDVKLRKHYF